MSLIWQCFGSSWVWRLKRVPVSWSDIQCSLFVCKHVAKPIGLDIRVSDHTLTHSQRTTCTHVYSLTHLHQHNVCQTSKSPLDGSLFMFEPFRSPTSHYYSCSLQTRAEMDSIKIMSMNCKGLGDQRKRRDVMHYIRDKKYDVVFLQD